MQEQVTKEERVVTGCEWDPDEDGVWNTTCGKSFVLNDGGPIENDMKYCPYCGLCLDQLPYTDAEADEEFCMHGHPIVDDCALCDQMESVYGN